MDIKDIVFIYEAHQNHPTKDSKAFRKWDGKTPYSMHPIWCAATIETETILDDKTRRIGSQSLLYHDVLEDTTVELPYDLPLEVVQCIKLMTFPGGSKQEMEEIWDLPPEIRLFKLYDKVCIFFDGTWMSEEKYIVYLDYIRKLAHDVRSNYGNLNIVKIANAITK